MIGYNFIISFAEEYKIKQDDLLKYLIYISILFVFISQSCKVILRWYEKKVIYDIWQYTYLNFFKFYLDKPLIFFSNINTKEVNAKIRDHIHNFCVGYVAPFLKIIGDLINILAFIPIIFFNFTTSIFVLIIISFLLIVLVYLSIKKKIDSFGSQLPMFSEKSLIISSEAFENYKNLKIYDASNYYLSKIQKISRKYINSIIGISLLSNIPPALIEVLAYVVGFIFLYSTLIINDFDINNLIPLFALIILSLRRLLPAFTSIFQQFAGIRYYYSTFLSIKEEVLFANKNLDFNKVEKLEKTKLNINLINLKMINFSYQNKKIIENFNLIINRGDRILINGKSGSGKSTLINIITGFLKPDNGEVLINEKNINEVIQEYYLSLSYFSQESFFVDGTLEKNIILFENKSDQDFLFKILKIVKLDEIVKNLPNGIDSDLGENANKLSIGQKQRLAIARAIYRKPELLVLDESTSNLDLETEKYLISNLLDCNFVKTIIFVSHRNTLEEKFNKIINL